MKNDKKYYKNKLLRHGKQQQFFEFLIAIYIISMEPQDKKVQQKQYQVQSILDRKADIDENFLYLIKWVGWPRSKATWEPLQNLLGDQAVQRMVSKFDQHMLKKSKKWNSKQMDGTLNSWRKKKIKQYDQNVNIDNLVDKSDNNVFIDLQEASCELIAQKQQEKIEDSFMNGIRKKIVTEDNLKYPFEESVQKKDYFLNRKVKCIEKIQKIDEQMKCLVQFTSKLYDHQWFNLDLIRLFYPKMLLQYYEEFQKNV